MNEGGPEKVFQEFKGNCKGDIEADFYTDVSKIPDPVEQDPAYKNLLILDDIMLGPQSKVEAYYTRGRYNNFDVFYILQSYFRLPRQTVRENANFFVFFLQDKNNLSHIYNVPAMIFHMKVLQNFVQMYGTKTNTILLLLI